MQGVVAAVGRPAVAQDAAPLLVALQGLEDGGLFEAQLLAYLLVGQVLLVPELEYLLEMQRLELLVHAPPDLHARGPPARGRLRPRVELPVQVFEVVLQRHAVLLLEPHLLLVLLARLHALHDAEIFFNYSS